MGASLSKKKNQITETYKKEESDCLTTHPTSISFKRVIYKGYKNFWHLNNIHSLIYSKGR